MDFGAVTRKRSKNNTYDNTVPQPIKVEVICKKSKRDLKSQAQSDEDEIQLIPESPSPELIDMETEDAATAKSGLNSGITNLRLSLKSEESVQEVTVSYPEDVKTYRQTRHLIDPCDYVPDPDEKPLRDPRANRPDPVGYVPLYPRKGCAQTEETRHRLSKFWEKFHADIYRSQRQSIVFREWAKPLTAAGGTLKNLDAFPDTSTSFAGRIRAGLSSPDVQDAVADRFDKCDQNANFKISPSFDLNVENEDTTCQSNENSLENEPDAQSTSNFELRIDTGSEDEYLPVINKKSKNRKKNRKGMRTDEQNYSKRTLNSNTCGGRDSSKASVSNTLANGGKRNQDRPQMSRARSIFESSAFTPCAGRKIRHLFNNDDSDGEDFLESKFVVKSNSIGIRRRNANETAADNEVANDCEDKRRTRSSRSKLSLTRNPLRVNDDVNAGESSREEERDVSRSIIEELDDHNSDGEVNDEIECPMCSRMFRANVIEEHAFNCQGLPDDSLASGEAASATTNLAAFVPLQQLSVKLFDFKNQFPIKTSTSATRKNNKKRKASTSATRKKYRRRK